MQKYRVISNGVHYRIQTRRFFMWITMGNYTSKEWPFNYVCENFFSKAEALEKIENLKRQEEHKKKMKQWKVV